MAAPLIITASGIRGLVNENFDPVIASYVAIAFSKWLKTQFQDPIPPVILGGDTRPTHDLYKNAIITGLTASGISSIDIGMVPTPTCQHLIRHHKAAGALVITASHNPIEYNGIKLMNKSGAFLSQEEFNNFNAILEPLLKDRPEIKTAQRSSTHSQDKNALDIHIQNITDALDCSSISKANLLPLIDPNNGTGAIATPKLFKNIGQDYRAIGADPHAAFSHTPEPSKANLSELLKQLKEGNYDIGFAQDPDADRLVICDENGGFIGEDYSLALCIDYILSTEKQPSPTVVVNLSTSLVIKDIAKRHNATVITTKIGETHVTEGIKSHNALVGGEGNGGIIFPKVGWGRDSLTGMVIALKYLAESGKTVSEICSSYPKYTLLRDKIQLENKAQVSEIINAVKEKFPDAEINTEDGIKLSFADSWLHVRPSNTEPIIRLFAEAPSEDQATSLLEKAKA